ncbi:hypothetical protein YC2023_085227 [Brassica napus]
MKLVDKKKSLWMKLGLDNMYMERGDVDAARCFFDYIVEPCLVYYNTIITGHAGRNRTNEALSLFQITVMYAVRNRHAVVKVFKLTEKLVGVGYTTIWTELLDLVMDKTRDSTLLFLTRYTFQAVVYSIWRERNNMRHGDATQSTIHIVKYIDKLVRNRTDS